MKVTYSWLKDFVDIKLSPEALAEKLTMAGIEVVSLEEKRGDFVFEIEITSNRPDWLSIFGIAREVAVITGKKLKETGRFKKADESIEKTVNLEIQDKKDCPLYVARILRDVKIGPSPQWIKDRLELLGCRSVNNVVDITNYLLFEFGQPMHAFDLDKISGNRIIVRRARAGEKIITIDDAERMLNQNILVIADDKKPLALAGIMGGKESEVTFGTRNILLESASFDPILVRRARQAQGLQSESSYRFERGVDLAQVDKVSLRAVELIKSTSGATKTCFIKKGAGKEKEINVPLIFSDLERILGVSISPLKIRSILSGLGLKVSAVKKNSLLVKTPSFRQDIKIEEDLIEEIARIYGYDKIPVSLPKVCASVTLRDRRDLSSVIKNILLGLGLDEAVTYSLTDRRVLFEYGQESSMVEVLNPLSQEQSILRTTLIPGLMRLVAYNLNQKQDCVCFFEIGNIFAGKKEAVDENLNLGIVLSGERKILLKENTVNDELSICHLKGVIEKLFLRIGIKDYGFTQEKDGTISLLVSSEPLGKVYIFNSAQAGKFGIKNNAVFAAEINLEKLLRKISLDSIYIPIPKYPNIVRDISFVIKKENSLEKVTALLKEKGLPLLKDLKVKDYYQGKQIPEGYRGLTVSCIYGSSERTLVEEEIAPLDSLIRETLINTFGAKIR